MGLKQPQLACPEFMPSVITEEEYLASELESPVKREYIAGQVYAMTGASVNHNCIAANVLRKFGNHLEGTP